MEDIFTNNNADDTVAHLATHDAIAQCIASLKQEDDVSFFLAIRRIIQASGMNYSFIATLATINSVDDPFYHPEMTSPMRVSTVSRIARGEDLPHYATMKRLVVYGLGLSEDECDWLDGLRRKEDYVHHTTNPQIVTAKAKAYKSRSSRRSNNAVSNKDVPSWAHKDPQAMSAEEC